MSAAFSEVRWKMLGGLALTAGVALVVAFRYVAHADGSGASQDAGPVVMESAAPIGSTSAEPSWAASPAAGDGASLDGGLVRPVPTGRPAPGDLIFMEDRKGTAVGMYVLNVSLESSIRLPGTSANPSSPKRYEIATIKVQVESGSLDYSPQMFTFNASDGHTYQPAGAAETSTATSAPFGAGHLLAGQSLTGDVVFVVPAGKGKLQLTGIAGQDLPSWRATV